MRQHHAATKSLHSLMTWVYADPRDVSELLIKARLNLQRFFRQHAGENDAGSPLITVQAGEA